MIHRVELTKRARKDLEAAPRHVQMKFRVWVSSVESVGLTETRKAAGWHDEPLQGDRQGQRSIRLNRQWRAIYVERPDGTPEFARVEEVMPHDY